MDRRVGFSESNRYACLEDLQQVNDFGTINMVNLDYCGREECEPGYQFGPHVREGYVIHIILSGKGSYQVDGKTFELKKGDAFLIYPGKETLYKASETEPWTYIWMGFHGYRSEELLRYIGFSSENPTIIVKKLDQAEEIIQNMLKYRQLTLPNELKRLRYMLDMFSLFMEERESVSKENDYPNTVYVKCAVDYIMQNFNRRLKINELADNIGISRSYLTTIFKKEMHMSPQEYLINFRMDYAANLLKTTNEPINIVAAECGYEDSLSFSKVFKQHFNQSPKSYRDSKPELIQVDEKGKYTTEYPL